MSLPLEIVLLDPSVLLFLLVLDVDSLVPIILKSLFLLVIFLLLLLLVLIVFLLADDARGLIEVHLHAGVREVRGGVGQLLRLVVREDSHFLLHLERIAPDCLQVGSDLVVVSILVDIVLSGRDGESLVVLVLGHSVLLLVAQMLLVLILDLLEVVKDLGDLLFVGGDPLVEEEKRFGDDLKLAHDLLEVLGKLLILSKASTSVLLIAIGIRLGRNNDAL